MEGDPQSNVPLAPLTTWKIGGAAEWFWSPESVAELTGALAWARGKDLPVHIIGRGSNILIADRGLKGLVICLRNLDAQAHQFESSADRQGILEVSAGMSLPRLSKVAAQQGFGGYEFYIGIPGTVGGAVTINAGYGPSDERQTANRCVEVQTVSLSGELIWRPYVEYHPIYRHTDLVGSDLIVTAARFALTERSTKEQIRAETAQHLAMRRERQPLTRPTAGSVFKGTKDGVPAAVLIDRCGLKGLQVGGAIVSPKHANWIENMGGARASDVLELIQRIKAVVLEQEGIELEAEVRFLS